MSIKEKLHQKIDNMTEANLEWLNGILETEEYPDVRVQRTPEEMDEIRSLLKELSAPMTIEQKTAFNEAMQS
jgi:hypothetical protein